MSDSMQKSRKVKSSKSPRRGLKWIAGIIIIALLVFGGLFYLLAQTGSGNIPGSRDILANKVIKWGDGSTETVQIDKDGFFFLNGQKKRLIGICDPMIYKSGNPWSAENRAILNKELDYLQARGVRLYQFNLWPWDQSADNEYKSVLDMFYAHKMLIVPIFSVVKDSPDLLATTDWHLSGSNHVSTYLVDWINHVKAYPNVVAISLENEMDISSGNNITLNNATSYMNMLYKYAKANTNIPLITKFGSVKNSAFATTIQNAFLHYSAIPCFDTYFSTTDGFAEDCIATKDWYSSKTNCSQMWLTEMNYISAASVLDSTRLTGEMIDAVLAHDASAVFLFCAQDSQMPGAMFFDTAGNPTTNLETLLKNVPSWQAVIP
jgi:hypothetical protein